MSVTTDFPTRILDRFPGASGAQGVEEVDAQTLSPGEFRACYVGLNRPFVARGAAAHWAACRTWTAETLGERLKGVDDLFVKSQGIVAEPMREYAGDYVGAERDKVQNSRPRADEAKATAFLERLKAGEKATAYAVPFDTPGLDRINADIGSLPFFGPVLGRKSFQYESRFFLYRGGYTDWHFHYADEGITVQALGKKDFLMLPPDARTFEIMWRILRRHGFWEDVALSDPRLSELEPAKVRLNPGDALYIPVFWWHAVEPADDEIGVTLAFTFSTPFKIQFDARFAAVRWSIRQAAHHKGYRKLLPVLLLGCAAALLRHPFSPPHLRTQ